MKLINLIKFKKNSFRKANFNKDKKKKNQGNPCYFKITKKYHRKWIKNNKMLEDGKKKSLKKKKQGNPCQLRKSELIS